MSIPKSKRRTSTMQFIATAEKLASKTFRFTNSLPKRYTFKIGNPLFEHAEMVVYHCRAANSIYVNSQSTYDQRRLHLTEAQAELLHVETLLGILHETTFQLSEIGECKPPNDNVYSEFADLIEEETKLISGCKKHDTDVYNNSEAGS